MDLIVVHAVQNFDGFELFPCPNPIPGPERPPATLGVLMIPEYCTLDMQTTCSDSGVHRPPTAIRVWKIHAVRECGQQRCLSQLNRYLLMNKANLVQ